MSDTKQCNKCDVTRNASEFAISTRSGNFGELQATCLICKRRRTEKSKRSQFNALAKLPPLSDVLERLETLQNSPNIDFCKRIRVGDILNPKKSPHFDPRAPDDGDSSAVDDDNKGDDLRDEVDQDNDSTAVKDVSRQCADAIAGRVWDALRYQFV